MTEKHQRRDMNNSIRYARKEWTDSMKIIRKSLSLSLSISTSMMVKLLQENQYSRNNKANATLVASQTFVKFIFNEGNKMINVSREEWKFHLEKSVLYVVHLRKKDRKSNTRGYKFNAASR